MNLQDFNHKIGVLEMWNIKEQCLALTSIYHVKPQKTQITS